MAKTSLLFTLRNTILKKFLKFFRLNQENVKRKACKFGGNVEFTSFLVVCDIFYLTPFVQIRFRFDVYNYVYEGELVLYKVIAL